MQSTTMNDGAPDQRSTLASYKLAKTDASDNEHSEKALMREGRSEQSFGTTAAEKSSPKNDESSSLSDRINKHNTGKPVYPSASASKAMADMLKEAAETVEDDADFDMAMVPMSFPQRLFDILSNEEHADVISWLPHGNGFIIHNKRAFSEEVLPRYFKESKFTSFTRKLNRWGFTRVTRGSESGAYYHPHFQKGNLRRTLLMQCAQRNSSKKKKAASGAATDQATVGAGLNLGSLLGGQLGGGVDQLALARQLQQLDQLQAASAALLGQREEKMEEAARAEAILRIQEQEKLSRIEELQKQNQPQDAKLSQYEQLIAQLGGSSASSSQVARAPSSAFEQQQSLIAQLRNASSLGNNPLLGGNAAAAMPPPPPNRAMADQHASILEAANALQRSDPAAYMSVLMAAKKKAESRASAAAMGDSRSQQLMQAQQQQEQQIRDMLMQRASSQSHQQSLPPKKR